ncbi:transcription factor bHLH94-like [Chenopodium quinoa]|uniref:transcription factor bHLH94-like n=1 Tax=Chenopodium quinoa TaxID=63459 RepID=UPI000B79A7EF|nr:transcription factor bHLH94-like [Chenopodium quinoa]
MALEAVVFFQDPLINNNPCSTTTNNFGINFEFSNNYFSHHPSKFFEDTFKLPLNVGLFDLVNNNNNIYDFNNNINTITTPDFIIQNNILQWQQQQQHHQQYVTTADYSSPEDHLYQSGEAPAPSTAAEPPVSGGVRRKRRRRSCKNKEEVEHQRMTHIAVERNRRKQMNEYLAVIRSLMPPSYVQRGDQASIVGGAINYVKELEQLLQSMEAQKTSNKQPRCHDHHQNPTSPPPQGGGDNENKNVGSHNKLDSCTEPTPFADFFSFPQYSTRSKPSSPGSGSGSGSGSSGNSVSCSNSGVGDIEVTMVESHANVKILAKKEAKQLIKLIAGFQGLRLNVLHLNVTTVDSFVLYSLSLKVEEGCQLNSVDDIAAAANHILGQIKEEAVDQSL